MRVLLGLALAAAVVSGCNGWGWLPGPPQTSPARDTVPAHQPPRPAPVARDTQLEQRVSRLELRLLEKEAQVEELQARLDEARHEVVRAMAKLQSLATRAEAASGMAEAEIALQALRSTNGSNAPPSPEYGQGGQQLHPLSVLGRWRCVASIRGTQGLQRDLGLCHARRCLGPCRK